MSVRKSYIFLEYEGLRNSCLSNLEVISSGEQCHLGMPE